MTRSFFAAALLVTTAAIAQSVPSKLSFTARIVDSGAPVSGNRDFVFKLFPTLMAGTEVWTETRNAVPVVEGAVNLDLGASTPLTDTLFDGQVLYLEVTVGGTVLSPRTSVLSVPYALRSNVANKVGVLSEPEIQKRVTTGCATGSAIRSIAADGTVTCQAAAVSVNDGGVSGITGVFGGAGLTGGGVMGDINLAVSFVGSGAATTAARSDHNHTGTYLPLGPFLACGGTDKVVSINAAGSVVCAPDVSNSYTTQAGGGISLSGSQFGLITCPVTNLLAVGVGGAWSCIAPPPAGVTSVAATAPLTSSGGAAPTIALPMCPVNQVLKSTGASWSCQVDVSGTGTVTSIATGAGLTGGPLTTTGSIGLAPGVQYWPLGQPGCAAGTYLRSIAADGTPSCVNDANSGGTVISVGSGLGLIGGPITGSGALSVSFGASAGTVTQGNDVRLPPAPSGAGQMLYDNGSAWVQVGAGPANSVLVGGAAPAFSMATGITSVGTLGSVNVTGVATVGSLAFATPKTASLNLHASAFFPVRSTEGYTTGAFCCGTDRSYVAPLGTSNSLAAPVSLPDGATITNLSCQVLDNSSTYNVQVWLREAVANFVICNSQTSALFRNPTYQPLSASCGNQIVDNTAQSWFIQMFNNGGCGTSCGIMSCNVTYTMNSLP